MRTESVSFDRAAQFYDATRGFPPGVAEQVAMFVNEIGGLSSQHTLLEIGIGTGRIALPLAPYVQAIYGADLSREMLSKLHDKQTGEQIFTAQADVSRLPFVADSFDHVMAVHIFHLVADPLAVGDEIARVLKPGGTLLHCGNGAGNAGMRSLWAAWESAVQEGRTHNDVWTRFNQQLIAHGWTQDGEGKQYAYTYTRTPRDFVDNLRGRVWSSQWFMSDELIETGIAAVLRAVDEQYGGDLDYPVEMVNSFELYVLRPPAAAKA